MYKMDRNVSKAQSYKEAENDKLFPQDLPLGERLKQAWFLTATAFGLDPECPPKMEKRLVAVRKHLS